MSILITHSGAAQHFTHFNQCTTKHRLVSVLSTVLRSAAPHVPHKISDISCVFEPKIHGGVKMRALS